MISKRKNTAIIISVLIFIALCGLLILQYKNVINKNLHNTKTETQNEKEGVNENNRDLIKTNSPNLKKNNNSPKNQPGNNEPSDNKQSPKNEGKPDDEFTKAKNKILTCIISNNIDEAQKLLEQLQKDYPNKKELDEVKEKLEMVQVNTKKKKEDIKLFWKLMSKAEEFEKQGLWNKAKEKYEEALQYAYQFSETVQGKIDNCKFKKKEVAALMEPLIDQFNKALEDNNTGEANSLLKKIENYSPNYSKLNEFKNKLNEAVKKDMVFIPEGWAYIKKDNGEYDKVLVPAFYILKREVTYKEFMMFLRANSEFPTPRFWPGTETQMQKVMDEPFGGAPIEYAMSYATWNCNLSLPTVAQWIRAARLDTKNLYPWGNSKPALFQINSKESNINSVIKWIPDNKDVSIANVFDLSGNLSEWTITEVPEEKNKYKMKAFVVKGGSFLLPAKYAQIDEFYIRKQSLEFIDIGFRTVLNISQEK